MTSPPLVNKTNPYHPIHDLRYKNIDISLLPGGESLHQTKERVLPFWKKEIVPSIKMGRRVIIVAHGNSLRALIQHLDHLNEEKIMQVNVPTGIPLVYQLDENMNPIDKGWVETST